MGISELSHTANSLVEIALSDCPLSRTVLDSQNSTAKRFWRDSSRFSRLWVFARSRFVKLLAQIAQKQLTRLRRRPFTLFKGALWPIEPSIDWECGDHVNRTTRNGDVVSRIALLLFKARAILEPRRRQSRRARRSCIAFGWCESSSPRGSSIVPGLRGGRSSYSQSASEGTRRIGAITLRRRSRDTRSHDERPNARELLVGQPRRGVPDADHGVRSAAPELCRCRGVQQASRHVHGRQRCAPASPGPRMFTTSVLSRGRGDLFFLGSTRS